ncbi:MAG TPA: recombinase family protein [Planctomycetaceae bacterium]|jgi:site-specific DNA recombinase|nr:recombinase family protein [Planctomycetaceae bacterium]
MLRRMNPGFVPRDGRILKVVSVSRISTDHQDERSLEDQLAKHKNFLAGHYSGQIAWKVIKSRGSGEHLDRQELSELEALIESEEVDLVIAEDLGRICRRRRAYDFCEICVDHNVRLIAINDRVDTVEDGWQDGAFISTWHHERSNRDTSERIKRTLRNLFEQGGVCQTFPYGYIKPANTKSDADVRKDPEAEPVYDEWFTRLEKGQPYTEVGDWLNAKGVVTGPWCDKKSWDGPLVSKRVNKTGRHRNEKAPQELQLFRSVPHLAFIDAERYDRVIRLLAERYDRSRRKGENGKDTRAGVSRKRSRWPGQHIFCGICGRPYLWGGNGEADHLMCQGAKLHRCWLGTSCDGRLAAKRISAAVFEEIERLPDFDEALFEAITAESKRLDGDREEQLARLSASQHKVQREIDNLVAFIRGGDSSPRVREDLAQLEEKLHQLRADTQKLAKAPSDGISIPPVEELKRLARAAFAGLAGESPEFGRAMKLIIPKIVVFPVRLCAGGLIVLRAQFGLQLARLLPDERVQQALQRPLERVLTINLFDPPQPEAFRRRVCDLRAAGMTQKEAADQCGLTVTAAQDAAGLQRRMDALGLTDPYVAVIKPPVDYCKLRRHLHRRYRFEPLEDAGKF